jgi:hypothetical protein
MQAEQRKLFGVVFNKAPLGERSFVARRHAAWSAGRACRHGNA